MREELEIGDYWKWALPGGNPDRASYWCVVGYGLHNPEYCVIKLIHDTDETETYYGEEKDMAVGDEKEYSMKSILGQRSWSRVEEEDLPLIILGDLP